MMAKNEILSLSMRNIKKGSALKSKATHAIHPVPVNAMKMSSGPRKFYVLHIERYLQPQEKSFKLWAVGLLHKEKCHNLWTLGEKPQLFGRKPQPLEEKPQLLG